MRSLFLALAGYGLVWACHAFLTALTPPRAWPWDLSWNLSDAAAGNLQFGWLVLVHVLACLLAAHLAGLA